MRAFKANFCKLFSAFLKGDHTAQRLVIGAGLLVSTGLFLWWSGLDARIQYFIYRYDTPLMNDVSRFIGMLGLGRVQMFVCLSIASILGYRAWPKASRPPLWQWPFYVLGSAVWLWMRMLAGVVSPVKQQPSTQPPVFCPQGLLDFVQGLSTPAKAWLMAVPIMFVAGVWSLLFKIIFGRPRPKKLLWEDLYDPQWFSFSAAFWSFPSGHTVTTFAIVAVLWPLYPRFRWLILTMGTIGAMARVTAITPHFTGDILAGAALGYTIGWFLRKKCQLYPV